MIQDQYTPSQLQSLIEKYQRELLESYKRKTLDDTEIAASTSKVAEEKNDSAELSAKPTATEGLKTEIVETHTPAIQQNDCDSPPYPEAVNTMKAEQTDLKSSDISAVFKAKNNPDVDLKLNQPLSGFLIEDECPPPPSMLRPKRVQAGIPADKTTENIAACEQVKPCIEMEDECPPPPSMFRPIKNIQTSKTKKIKETSAFIFDEECPPTPSMFRPFRNDKRAVLASMPDPDTSKPANLQVKVTTGRQSIPVNGARVTVSRNGVSTQKIQKVIQTDRTGSTPVISIPNCGPLSPYTIEVTANGFCSARYSGIPLYNGITAVQHVDLIPLPTGERSDLLILFDQSKK